MSNTIDLKDIPRKAHHNFNYTPLGWEEIAEEEFYIHYFFHFLLDAPIYNQIYYDEDIKISRGLFSAKLFDLAYAKEGCYGLGVAISWDWKKNKASYHRYGEAAKWKKFQSEFAAQFAGDNS